MLFIEATFSDQTAQLVRPLAEARWAPRRPRRQPGSARHQTLCYLLESGRYAEGLDRGLDALDYESWRRRQAEARARGTHAGIGMSFHIATGDHDAVIRAIPTCVEPGTAPRYAAVTSGEHPMNTVRKQKARALPRAPAR